jgi:hypothetical protein
VVGRRLLNPVVELQHVQRGVDLIVVAQPHGGAVKDGSDVRGAWVDSPAQEAAKERVEAI